MLEGDTQHTASHPLPVSLARLPRNILGEWRCLDCQHLSYGKSETPCCPNCRGSRLAPTKGDASASPGSAGLYHGRAE